VEIIDIKTGAVYGIRAVPECISFITHIDVLCGEREHGGSVLLRRL